MVCEMVDGEVTTHGPKSVSNLLVLSETTNVRNSKLLDQRHVGPAWIVSNKKHVFRSKRRSSSMKIHENSVSYDPETFFFGSGRPTKRTANTAATTTPPSAAPA